MENGNYYFIIGLHRDSIGIMKKQNGNHDLGLYIKLQLKCKYLDTRDVSAKRLQGMRSALRFPVCKNNSQTLYVTCS